MKELSMSLHCGSYRTDLETVAHNDNNNNNNN